MRTKARKLGQNLYTVEGWRMAEERCRNAAASMAGPGYTFEKLSLEWRAVAPPPDEECLMIDSEWTLTATFGRKGSCSKSVRMQSASRDEVCDMLAERSEPC